MKTIKFITPTGRMGASSRYRVYQYLEYLKKIYNVEVYPFLTDQLYDKFKKGDNKFVFSIPRLLLKRIILLKKIKKDDIIFIHRDAIPFGPMIFEKILKLKGCKIILDLDDAVYCTDTSEISNKKNKLMYKFKYGKRFNRSIKLANVVVCGNKFIEEYVKKINSNTVIIPTTIDTNKVIYKKNIKEKDELKIVWVGNPGNTDYVLKILPQIDSKVKNVDKKIKFILIGNRIFDFSKFKNIEIMSYNWSEDTEYNIIRECNVGIMPLNDSEWSKGKCGLKILQYMSVGVPAIASNVGVNADIIIENKNGFLVDNNIDSWVDIIMDILSNEKALENMEEYCRKFVEKKYSINTWIDKLIKVIEEV